MITTIFSIVAGISVGFLVIGPLLRGGLPAVRQRALDVVEILKKSIGLI